ncbi:hypothetical protein SARC_03476 [Sphaeroforma arctica JP610]|uniref:Uncharacterized protein n=1 Tax=Sphaeroforma arctica JP610 TaxID=667725 RepID=A0A0L0G5L0_9EUKA|nr:hypothetical protein SARC_03476 [Sphaeroforma arctica JP610]KNC84315.1 hypothetical protein SARC_03476 [Sphaeroforma arctica JP610]|eukprot:XP_014158217.1 hypothetical protein SARC_03476 [Sphaeroforma arctica JP610]
MSSTRTFSLARVLTRTRTQPSIKAIRASQLSIRSKLHTTGVLQNQAAYEEALAKSDNKRGKSRKPPNKVEATENTTKNVESVENETLANA